MKSQSWLVSLFLWFGTIAPGLTATPADPKVLHILNRLSFGPRPGDVAAVKAMGVERYIEQQLAPDTLPLPPSLTHQLAQLSTLNLTPPELLSQVAGRRSQTGPQTAEVRKAYQQKVREVLQQAVQARLLEAVASPRQLQEVMVDFWYNHFNVYAGKGIDRLLVGAYEQQAIRPYALGRFRDLLGATAHHPAMLFYLDNWQNTAPNSPGARGRFLGLNENYARELMELHTLGADGGYTQQDVITLAKLLTGWGFRRGGLADNPFGFYFDPKRHDDSDQTFLGHPIHGSGVAAGEQALDRLAKSPATAHHISYELAQYFVADNPPKPLVDRLTKRFLATDGNIRDVLSTLFHSPEFLNSTYYNAKFKTPYQYVVSAVRATGIPVTNVRPLYAALQQLGMPIYGCLTPDGYKNTEATWLNPDAITRRISFATELGTGRLPLTRPNEPTALSLGPQAAGAGRVTPSVLPNLTPMPMAVSTPADFVDADQLLQTLGGALSAKTTQTIANSAPHLRASLLLGSPEFMHR